MEKKNSGMPEMDDLIEAELHRLATATFGEFACAGAFLFQTDALREILEPAFSSDERVYNDLSFYFSLEIPDEGENRVGVATIAFVEGEAYSARPADDRRIGDAARSLQQKYGVSGSMMAVRVGAGDVPIAVAVVYANHVIELPRKDEMSALHAFAADTGKLELLLNQRRSLAAQRDFARYAELLSATLASANAGMTVRQTCEDAATRLTKLFSASSIHIRLSGSDVTPAWYPDIDVEQQESLEAIAAWRSTDPATTINRQSAASALRVAFLGWSKELAWCRVSHEFEGQLITCIGARCVKSFSDFWTENELQILADALGVLAIGIKRAQKLDNLLDEVATSSLPQQFRFWCYLLDTYFGIDQVLVTKVCRDPRKYVIKAKPGLNHGFSRVAKLMESRPKEFQPTLDNVPGRQLDVMVRILADHLEDLPQSRQVYVANCDHPLSDRFTLDVELILAAGLKGPVYFVPCYSDVFSPNGGSLKSILHLGASSGKLRISDEQFPLLLLLGERVAKLLEAQDTEEMNESIRAIRDVQCSDILTMKNICLELVRATYALGCTLFLNTMHFRLIGVAGPTLEALEEAFYATFRNYHRWNELLGTDRADRIRQMVAAFLGVDDSVCDQILSSPERKDLARLVAPHLYARVAHATGGNATSPPSDPLHALSRLQRFQSTESEDLAVTFGDMLCSECYLPGLGLTGWVLRYATPLNLVDKQQSTIHAAVRSNLFPKSEPAARQQILNGLRYMGIRESDSTISQNQKEHPTHVNHLPDHSSSSHNDPFVGIPIEGFGISELPAGVIRLSSASTMKASFSRQDEAAVIAVARHIGNVLRMEHMSQKAYFEQELSQRGDDLESIHIYKRFHDEIFKLEQAFSQGTDGKMPDSLSRTLLRLKEICDKALAKDDFEQIALGVRRSSRTLWSLQHLQETLSSWLKATKLPVSISFLGNKLRPVIARQSLVPACRVLEEIVRNFRRYGSVTGIRLLLAEDASVYVFSNTFDLDADSVAAISDWVPYQELGRTAGSGGGMKLVRDAEYCAGINVTYANIGFSSEELVIRIQLPIGQGVNA